MLKTKFRKAEAYIDTVVTVFISLLIMFLAINVFSYFVTYQKLNNIGNNIIRYAAINGDTNSTEVKNKIKEYITGEGLKVENVTVSFDGSDYIKNKTVQYGDTIALHISTSKKYSYIGKTSNSLFTLRINKIGLSEKYYNLNQGLSYPSGSEDTGAALYGDVNGDGIISKADSVLILNYSLFGEDRYPVNQDCDFNGDGYVDSKDVSYHKFYIINFGDVNEDGVIDSKDVDLFNEYFANYNYDTKTSTININLSRGDINGDGVINGRDTIFLGNFLAVGGNKAFFNTGKQRWTPTLNGDINCDGVVDETDLSLLQTYTDSGNKNLPDGFASLANADIDKDGKITTMDKRILERWLSGNFGSDYDSYFS